MWKDINGFLKDLRAYPEHFHKTDNKSLNLNSVPKSESTTKPWIFQATFKSLKENNFSIFSWTKVHPNYGRLTIDVTDNSRLRWGLLGGLNLH